MKIYGVQFDIEWEDKAVNFEKIRALLSGVEIEPDSLVVLPEMFATGFSMNVEEICEGETCKSKRFLIETAKQHRCYVLGGLVTEGENGFGRNEAVAVNPEGEEIARYCKLNPFTFGGETKHYSSGEEIVTFQWHDFTVCPFICYDLRFPEIFRKAVRRGTNLFIVIACWPEPRDEHWVSLLKARAIENQAYVVGVNRCGTDPKLTYTGRSVIYDPHGGILASEVYEETVICAELDKVALVQYRKNFPVLQDIKHL